MFKEVQEFIEDNLDLIDQENWYKIFAKGYQQYTQYFWEDFFTTLKLANISTDNAKNAMIMHMLDTIGNEILYCENEDLLPMSLKSICNRVDIDHYMLDLDTVVMHTKRAFEKGYFSSVKLDENDWVHIK